MPSLTLLRKHGQTIHLSGGIVITTQPVGTRRTKVTIDAPESVRIVRGELLERVEFEHDLSQSPPNGVVEADPIQSALDESVI